ncbi:MULTISPECIES: hypothetical protein [Vibrio]|uniref:Uncharacterized protein n=1 Tax=Vibrio bivalvicida TaxID=1276888 RepID=A0A177Y2R2_9VIBR|nr:MULTISPECIES: hypothetical protein [Vibrio]OAJ95101.1 hypothetical protein APB76_07405 [Vibrio bivalvicida]
MLSFSPFSTACVLYQGDGASHSLLLAGANHPCVSAFDFDIETDTSNEVFMDLTLAEQSDDHSSYWSDWLISNDTTPLISTNSASSKHFGVGVWVPNELEEHLADMSAENWIKSHGLQLSLGFGDLDAGTPRMRLDYRWHEQYDGDFMMQVEVPF